jgi:hypothetical protein
VAPISLADPSLACRTLESAKKLSAGVKNAHPIFLDEKALDAEVAKNDLVISLIPYTFHATVIKSAIRNKKNVVTTSYVSPAMLELEDEAKKAGITVMNEIGYVSGKPFSSYSGVSQEEFLLRHSFELFSLETSALEACMCREQQLQIPPRRSNCLHPTYVV